MRPVIQCHTPKAMNERIWAGPSPRSVTAATHPFIHLWAYNHMSTWVIWRGGPAIRKLLPTKYLHYDVFKSHSYNRTSVSLPNWFPLKFPISVNGFIILDSFFSFHFYTQLVINKVDPTSQNPLHLCISLFLQPLPSLGNYDCTKGLFQEHHKQTSCLVLADGFSKTLADRVTLYLETF